MAEASTARPLLARIGDALARSRGTIQLIQWAIVLFYFALLIIPAMMPQPPETAHIYDNLRLFAQFMFWGVWWPFVMLSTLLFGRVWCGIFCPEGAMTELASRHGLGRPIPRWIRWEGWPLAAFTCTTIYGQLVSVYEYPQAALLILGGSTIAALAVGFTFGKGKRVWCRYLCPANGVFSLLSKVAPLHYAVSEKAWVAYAGRAPTVNCAPLINIRHMNSASACHACARCSGHRDAVQLAVRPPQQEILLHHAPGKGPRSAEALMLIFGLIGVATAAFQWSASPWFVRIKTMAAEWLVDHDQFALLQDNAPWWLLTHYPEANDVFTWLDGMCILAFITGGALMLGTLVLLAVRLAARLANDERLTWQSIALALIPIAGVGIFLGLSMLTLSHLKGERLPLGWVPPVRMALLGIGTLSSAWLGLRLIVTDVTLRRLLAYAMFLSPLGLIATIWISALFG